MCGSELNVRHSDVERPRQPGKVTYSTSMSSILSTEAIRKKKQTNSSIYLTIRFFLKPGKLGNSTPFRLYVVAILISANSSSVSSLVKHNAVKPLIIFVYRRRTRSSQPHRRFRPVVTPHSRPRVCKCSPISYRNLVHSQNFSKRIFFRYIFEFSWKNTITNTCCISFNNTVDFTDVFRCKTKTGTNTTDTAIR